MEKPNCRTSLKWCASVQEEDTKPPRTSNSAPSSIQYTATNTKRMAVPRDISFYTPI